MHTQNPIENSFIPYSFNGMEKDDEVKGEGKSYDFGARMLDARVGRWFSIDERFSAFPHNSPYNFVFNNPIMMIDPNGEGPIVRVKGKTITVSTTIYFYDASGKEGLKKETVDKIAGNIQRRWNASRGKVEINGVKYKVKFEFSAEKITKDEAIVMSGNMKDGQALVGIGKNENKASNLGSSTGTGWFNTADELETGTTPAHEMTHYFGMEKHPETEKNDPPILYYDPEKGKNSESGDLMIAVPKNKNTTGYQVDITQRKVTQGDIDRLKLDQLLLNSDNTIKQEAVLNPCSGTGYVFDETGTATHANGMTMEEYTKKQLEESKPNTPKP